MACVKPLKCPPQNILVIRHRFIGDTVLLGPFLKNLRAAYPQARIDCLVSPGSGELLEHCPYVDKLLWMPTTKKGPDTGFWTWVKKLKAQRYDTAFVLKRSFGTAAMAALAGIQQRVGFATEGRGWLLTHGVPYPDTGHELEAFLSVLEGVGCPAPHRELEAWLPDEVEQRVTSLWAAEGLPKPGEALHLGLQLTSSNPAKQWPLERWERFLPMLGDALADSLGETSLYFHAVGGPNDKQVIERLRQRLPEAFRPKLLNLAGKLSLLETQAWLKRLTLLVGNDSGTLHLAASAGCPVVAIFGPMSPERWAPLVTSQVVRLGLPCQPCHLKSPCPIDHECLKDLPESRIVTACQQLLTTLKTPRPR